MGPLHIRKHLYSCDRHSESVCILKHSYTPAQSPNRQTGFLAHGLHISSESEWTLARQPALSLFPRGQVPLCFLLSPTVPHSLHQAPKTQGPGKSVKESLCLQNLFWASLLLLTMPVFPGSATWGLFRSELRCCRGSWPLGSPSICILDLHPISPQLNPSFPLYKIKW